MAALEPVATRPDRLTERVYTSIREGIVSRRLRPGEQLTETSVAEQLQVSKTPVREALQKLEYIGLLEASRTRGMRVVTPSRTAIRSAYEVRVGVEEQAARLVAERGGEDALSQVRSIALRCLRAAEDGDRDGFRVGDRDFHFTTAQASSNDLLTRLVHDAYDLTWTLRRRDVPGPDESLECAKQHVAIVEAIEGGDPPRAASRMREHVLHVQSLVLASFDAGPSGGHG